MLKPINGHLLISPIKHEDFVEGGSSYDEVGEVIAIADELKAHVKTTGNVASVIESVLKVGDKIYFDSYLVARYPSGNPDKPFWLVKYEDCRAIESHE